MASGGKIKYNARQCGYCHMGIDDYLYGRADDDAGIERAQLLLAQAKARQAQELERSNRDNKAGFTASSDIKSSCTITHPRFGKGKIVSWTETERLVEFPGYGVMEV